MYFTDFRHRNVFNFIVKLIAGFTAYTYTNLKNDCDRWETETLIQWMFHNPKSKIQNGIICLNNNLLISTPKTYLLNILLSLVSQLTFIKSKIQYSAISHFRLSQKTKDNGQMTMDRGQRKNEQCISGISAKSRQRKPHI
jgi:hypothetical protein